MLTISMKHVLTTYADGIFSSRHFCILSVKSFRSFSSLIELDRGKPLTREHVAYTSIVPKLSKFIFMSRSTFVINALSGI